MTSTAFVGGPLHGRPVPAARVDTIRAAWPVRRESSLVAREPLAVYVSRRYWSLYPIPGWELRLTEDLTRLPQHGGVQPVWTVRAWAQQFDHDNIEAFLETEWARSIDALLKGYEWRDDDVIDHFQPEADAASRRLAELTGTLTIDS